MGIGVELAIDQSATPRSSKCMTSLLPRGRPPAGRLHHHHRRRRHQKSGQRGGCPEQTPGRERHERQCKLAGQRERPAHRRSDPLRLYGQQRRFRAGAGQCGYIKIWQFDNSTPSELDFALRSLTASGAQSFIFDLRDNGGGILDDAISCIELVAPEGVLAYAEDKAGNRTLLGSSTGDSVISQPTVCLVNENTASAAELFASSLRTLCGTRLVGSTTMGKGTIQSSPQRLSDGSAVGVLVHEADGGLLMTESPVLLPSRVRLPALSSA